MQVLNNFLHTSQNSEDEAIHPKAYFEEFSLG
jgi:hypothetical protein